MISNRVLPMLRILRSPNRHYSLAAYLFGAALPGRREGCGPVAWLRGWPMPDVRPENGSIELGHVGLFPGVRLHCHGTGRIVIGNDSYLNMRTRVFAGRSVQMGQCCMVSWQTVITDCTTLGSTDAFAPVVLEDGVWIGSRVIILGGTHLGRGCIVGAGSVVQGVFPAGSVLVGRPAEVIA